MILWKNIYKFEHVIFPHLSDYLWCLTPNEVTGKTAYPGISSEAEDLFTPAD